MSWPAAAEGPSPTIPTIPTASTASTAPPPPPRSLSGQKRPFLKLQLQLQLQPLPGRPLPAHRSTSGLYLAASECLRFRHPPGQAATTRAIPSRL